MISKTCRTGGACEWRYHIQPAGGDVLVLLPGSLGAGAGTAQRLSEHLPTLRLLILEYAPATGLDETLGALDCILEREQIENVAIYGGSFGGMIAQTWAHRNPSRVTHLILCGTTPPDPGRLPSHRNALRILPWIPSFAIKFLLRVMLRAVFRKVPDPRWLIEYQHLSERFTKKDLLSRYRVAMDFDSARMPDFPASGKVLILEGEQDRFVKPSMRQMLRLHYPKAQAYLFKEAGHSLMMTHSEEWSRIVSGFLLG